jgi:tetratricopeptide (TPR) repeat protein
MGMMKIPPLPDPRDLRICGFASHEMELLRAGDGDRALGRLRLALRRAEELEAAPATEAQRADAAYEVARAYDGTGDDAAAEQWTARALAVPAFRASDAWVHHAPSLALRYLWRGDFARAEPLAAECVRHAREGRRADLDALAFALETHGQALIGIGLHRQAIDALNEVVRLARESAWIRQFRAGLEVSALMHLGRAHAALGNVDEALGLFDQAEAASAAWTTRSRLDVLLASAQARRAAGRPDEAAERARLACAWWDAIIQVRRNSGGDAAEAERERAALAAAWGV